MRNYIKFFVVLIFSINFALEANTKEIPSSFADLSERLMPSVVNISTTTTVTSKSNPLPFQFPPGSPFEDMFKDFGTPQERKTSALGSGFIIDEKGIVITNNHVIQGAEDIFVRVNGYKDFKAKVLGADAGMDLAVLQIESNEKFKTVKFGDSDNARIGDWVIAIGNPFGLGGTVTAGIISARNRSIGLSRYEDFIQTDASINQGNSGGPLFNMEGDVVGINTAILGQSGSIGIGFAIPSNSAKKVINQLIEFGETKRGWLGVRIQRVTKEIAEFEKLGIPRGALVASVADNSPSDKAGVKAGDIILEFDGKPINQMAELPRIVAETNVGKKVKLKIWRNKREITKDIILGRLETSDDFKSQGVITKKPKEDKIEELKISVRLLDKRDIQERNLPKNTTGVVITNIEEDMIEVGSFIGMAVMTKSEITIKDVRYDELGIIPRIFRRMGVKIERRGDDIYVPAQEHYEIEKFIDGSILTVSDAPWPGFTPDLLSIILVMATQAKGSVMIHQKMFESRLFFVDKLIDMGAQIILCDPHRATVIGLDHTTELRAVTMTSPDIRAGVSLLIAALSADGTSTIHNIGQIDRGYQNIDERLRKLGAKIKRVE